MSIINYDAGPLGGTLLGVSGGGFGGNASSVVILVGGEECPITKISSTEVMCRAPAVQSATNATVQVHYFLKKLGLRAWQPSWQRMDRDCKDA